MANDAKEEIQIYTDGSALEGKVGVAAILIHPGKEPRKLHYQLGPITEHTVHEAEMVGILLALQLVKTEPAGQTTITINVDNQAAIKVFQSELGSLGHHIAREALRLANRTQKHRGRVKYSLIIRWTVGHEGIKGNELADKEAKAAARGKTSDRSSLPAYLRCNLLTNLSAVKQSHNEKLKEQWTAEWRASDRGKIFAKIDVSTPSKKSLKLISCPDISRRSASLISQLSIAHVPLNQYLKRLKRADSARCPACGADKEDTEHFLLHCPGYAHERWALAKQAKKIAGTILLKMLFTSLDLAVPLANYIAATNRFDKQQ
jgi:ribonuclease HI